MSPLLQVAEERFHGQIADDLDNAVAQYKRRFGNVLDRDNARELFSEYSKSRESRQSLGSATYRPAGALVDEIYRREIVNPDPTGGDLVVFNAGGSGVGKTTGLAGTVANAQIVMDGTLSNYDKSWWQIRDAFTCGKKVLILYTQRPYEEALENIIKRAIDPENGRIVTVLMAALGRIRARENVLRLVEEATRRPNFAIRAVDNTGNRGSAVGLDALFRQKPEELDDLCRRGEVFVNGYFVRHIAEEPALTSTLRQRIFGEDPGPDGR